MTRSSGSFFSPRKIIGFLILLAIIAFVAVQSLWTVYVTNQTYTITFPRSTLLTEQAYTTIDKATALLKQDDKLKVRIVGHTSPQGDPGANLKLSQDRAEAVKGEFVYRGISEDRMLVEGVGGTEPPAMEPSEPERAYNLRASRVEVTVSRIIKNPIEYVTDR